MPLFLLDFWRGTIHAGSRFATTPREKTDVAILNKALLILIAIQTACLTSHLIHGLQRSAFMTAVFIFGLCAVHLLVRKGHINSAKITGLIAINYNTIVMGVFLGAETHIIDFLLLTALMPLYFFEIKRRKLIFWGIALSIVPYVLYYFLIPYITPFSLPIADQLNVYNSTTPMKVLCLCVILFLMYHKNAAYEKEVREKELEVIGQKKLYERILEQIPIDIVTFDKEFRYTYINSTAISDPEIRKWMIGKTNKDYFESRKLDIKTAIERDKILKEALEKETKVQIEETMVNRHGSMQFSLKGASPIYSENKEELLCLVGYSLDITGMKEAERKLKEYSVELERKNDDLHHFVNATSHDLKTPLRNIASYLQLLERKNQEKLDADSLSLIAYTVKSVKHLNQLIGDIYQYSVADRNDKPTVVTNLDKILEDILMQMESTITEKNAAVVYSGLPVLRVAPSHFGMVFSNLLNNALKYNTSIHPRIEINCTAGEDEYLFAVKDNGIGIQKEYQQQVFEIFQRLHTPDEYEGTGVGLAICNKIVENYGGRMWVQSEPGQGSVFYFTLAKEIVDPAITEEHQLNPFKKLAIAG